MIDQNLVRLVAEAGMIHPNDLVIEVGPGTGTLTEELLSRAGAVLTVEIDRGMARILRERFGGNEKFQLIEGDALAGKHELNLELSAALRAAAKQKRVVKLVANLPYNIASPLVIDLLIAGVEILAFTVQKEVADRLRAGVNDDAYGPLSIVAQMLSRIEVLRTLPPQAFWPAPKVDSALVRMTRENKLGERAEKFSTFVHQIFSFRRKTLKKSLTQSEYDPAVLNKLKIDPQLRPENLSPSQFLEMFDALVK